MRENPLFFLGARLARHLPCRRYLEGRDRSRRLWAQTFAWLTVSLGLVAAFNEFLPRAGFIKPVGQRFVAVAEQKIDEDTVLMDSVYSLNCPLLDMSPIAIEPDFTRKYLQSSNRDVLIKRIEKEQAKSRGEEMFPKLAEKRGHIHVIKDQLPTIFHAEPSRLSRSSAWRPTK